MSDQFPSQSHKSREPRVIQPVTTSEATIRRAPWPKRFKSSIIQGDAQSVWASMIWDTFFPSLSDNIRDAIHNGVDALFGGYSTSARRTSRYAHSSRSTNVSRHNPDRALGSSSGGGSTIDRFPDDARRNQDYSVIQIDSRVEAQEVINQMNLLIDQFDVVSVAEFLQMVRITPTHTDYKFGWEELGGAQVASHQGSYYLDLPRPIQLR